MSREAGPPAASITRPCVEADGKIVAKRDSHETDPGQSLDCRQEPREVRHRDQVPITHRRDRDDTEIQGIEEYVMQPCDMNLEVHRLIDRPENRHPGKAGLDAARLRDGKAAGEEQDQREIDLKKTAELELEPILQDTTENPDDPECRHQDTEQEEATQDPRVRNRGRRGYFVHFQREVEPETDIGGRAESESQCRNSSSSDAFHGWHLSLPFAHDPFARHDAT